MRNLAAFIILTTLCPLIGYAQNNAVDAKAGLLYGYSVPDADNTKPHRAWGLIGSAMLSPTLGVGGYYILADKQEGTGGRQFQTSLHGLALNHHIPSSRGDTFFSLRVGISKLESTDTASGDELIYSPYHWGLGAGYDYNLFSALSIGFEGSYLIYDDSETTTNGTTYTEDGFRTISFSITTKILF